MTNILDGMQLFNEPFPGNGGVKNKDLTTRATGSPAGGKWASRMKGKPPHKYRGSPDNTSQIQGFP